MNYVENVLLLFLIYISPLPGIIGPASKLYEVISMEIVENTADDQLYYTKIFLEKRVSNLLLPYRITYKNIDSER